MPVLSNLELDSLSNICDYMTGWDVADTMCQHMLLHMGSFVQFLFLFLQSINKGECPRELEPADRSTQVHVNLVKKDEEWEVFHEIVSVIWTGCIWKVLKRHICFN